MLLNIDADPRLQGLAPHQCDLVIATNVLHATLFMRTTLRNCTTPFEVSSYDRVSDRKSLDIRADDDTISGNMRAR